MTDIDLNATEWQQGKNYHRRLVEVGQRIGGLEQENASLREQLATHISDEERPLWRRITNQRRALRAENFWRAYYERKWNESRAEVARLTEERDGLAAVIGRAREVLSNSGQRLDPERADEIAYDVLTANPPATLAARDAEKKAEAWDEGQKATIEDIDWVVGDIDNRPNPYRSPQQGGQG